MLKQQLSTAKCWPLGLSLRLAMTKPVRMHEANLISGLNLQDLPPPTLRQICGVSLKPENGCLTWKEIFWPETHTRSSGVLGRGGLCACRPSWPVLPRAGKIQMTSQPWNTSDSCATWSGWPRLCGEEVRARAECGSLGNVRAWKAWCSCHGSSLTIQDRHFILLIWLIFLNFIFIYFVCLYLCMCMYVGSGMPQSMCGDQRTTCRYWLSPRDETQVVRLEGRYLHIQSHLIGSSFLREYILIYFLKWCYELERGVSCFIPTSQLQPLEHFYLGIHCHFSE